MNLPLPRMKFLLLFPIALILSAASCHKDALFVNAEKHLNQTYGSNERNKMDVYLPYHRDSTTGTVMLIHGGGWVAGDKSNWSPEIINSIIQQGFAVSCINYRYGCGDFHKQMEDIHLALDYLDANAQTWNTGSHKYGMAGASAGGHLALLYAHAFDTAHVVKAVVSMVGPTDLTDSLFHTGADKYQLSYVLIQFLGDSIQHNPQVYAFASPLFHYSNVPSLFLHGLNDDLVPPAQGVRMCDTLRAHGIATDTTMFGNAGHDLFGPKGINAVQILSETNLWFQTYMH